MEPYQALAAGIIRQAVDDLKKLNVRIDKIQMQLNKGKHVEQEKINRCLAEHKELMTFFQGEWCETLCDFMGLDHGAVVDRVRGIDIDRIRETKAV